MLYLALKLGVYESNFDYLKDEFKSLENLLRSYLKCKSERNFESKREEILSDFKENQEIIRLRLEKSAENSFFAPYYLRQTYGLNDLEWFCVVLTVMLELDEKYRKMILSIESAESLTYSAMIKLYFFTDDISKIENYFDVLSVSKRRLSSLCFVDGNPNIDKRLFDIIMSNSANEINIAGIEVFSNVNFSEDPLAIREDIAVKMSEFLGKSDESDSICVCISGENGIGKKTIVNRICKLCGKPIVYIDLKAIGERHFIQNVITGCRESLFVKGFVCFCGLDSVDDEKIKTAVSVARRFSGVSFLVSEKKLNFLDSLGLRVIKKELPELTIDERFKLWEDVLAGLKIDNKLDISELSGKFLLTPKQINSSVSDALMQNSLENKEIIDEKDIANAIYSQMTSNLSEKAALIKKKHTWNELVLNPDEKETIKRACNQLKYRRTVYEKWGMGNRILYGTGLSMLFAGPSGTGKTMAAQVVASDLGLEIYKVDLSRVISKYIGESEKNLGEIFDNAKKSNVILLFDETDCIFAKRTEVKDSHDRNANLETSYLLQKMEEHTGVTILTTNFLENIDKAFFRRINYVVHFAFPNAKARREIWEKMFNKDVPIAKDVDFDFLAEKFEISGGSIKNVALTAAFMAASEDNKIRMKHMIRAMRYEIKKQGKMVSKDDFGEYGYLI